MQIKISLLGPFEVAVEGQPIPADRWPSEKTKALLKILSGERGRLFLQDELIESLWPTLTPPKAAANLRGRVAELRKILEPGLVSGAQSHFIVTRPGGYALSKDAPCWIDTEEFSRLESQGRRAEQEERFGEAAHFYESALRLYRGEYLADDRYAEWAFELRERWRERRLDLLARLAECQAQDHRLREALASVRAALALSPLQETFYQQWMSYAYQSGDVAEAERAYKQCREVLKRELDVEPSLRTRQLYDEIHAQRIPLRESALPVLKPTRALPQLLQRPPFVGRGQEFTELISWMRAVQAGAGCLVLIGGEMGIGKTRLAEECGAWAEAELKARVLVGHCYEMKTPLPLQPLLEAVSSAIPLLDRIDLQGVPKAWLGELTEFLPALSHLISDVQASPPLPTEYKHHRLFDALAHIVAALARRQPPLVLQLEALQWADSCTVDFLIYLLPKMKTIPVCLLGTYRPEEVGAGHLLHQLLQHPAGKLKEMRLTPLSRREVALLLENLLIEMASSQTVVSDLYRQSQGNPFFLIAQVQALYEEGALSEAGQPLCLPASWPPSLPAPAAELIRHRIQRLPVSRQRVLQLLAVWGDEIEISALDLLWTGTWEELHDHLQELIRADYLVATESGYAFSHSHYQAVIYQMMEEPRRRWLHQRIARQLQLHGKRRRSQPWYYRLAHHSERAGHRILAVHYYVKALHRSRLQGENDGALQFAAHGRRLLRQIESELVVRPALRRPFYRKQFQLLCEEARVRLQLGQQVQLEAPLKELIELADRLGETRWRAEAYGLLATWHERAAQYEQAVQAAQAARAAAQQIRDVAQRDRWEAESLLELGRIYLGRGDYREAHEHLAESLDLFERLGDVENQIYALNKMGHIELRLGEIQTAQARHQRALKLAQRIRSEEREGETLTSLGLAQLKLGSYEQALQNFDRVRALAERFADRVGLTFLWSNQASAYHALGAYRQAEEACRQALVLVDELGNPVERGQIRSQLGWILGETGQWPEARDHLETALTIFRKMGATNDEAEGLRRLAEVCLASGDSAAALDNIQQASTKALERQPIRVIARCHVTWSAILLEQGLAVEAAQKIDKVLCMNADKPVEADTLTRAYFRHFQALQALQRLEEARASLQNAHSLLKEIAQRIQSPEWRESFLSVPWRREVLEAAQRLLGPQKAIN